MSNKKSRRRSIRLQGYDYNRWGAYFMTFVTQERACLFGGVTTGQVIVSPFLSDKNRTMCLCRASSKE